MNLYPAQIERMKYQMDIMTRRKLTALIVAGALAAAGVSIVLLKRNQTAASQAPAATAQDGNAERPADAAPAQIEQAPRYSQDVFVPPPSSATGSAPLPPPARK